MKARFKLGLIVGLIGLVLNVCVASAFGFCGPAVSLIAGAVAGYFTARQEKLSTKGAGAQAGAISGLVAGVLIILGQVIGAVGALAFMQASGTKIAFGTIPPPSADITTQLTYYLSGMGTGICFGVIGAVLSALAGAGTGYLGTPDPEPQAPPMA